MNERCQLVGDMLQARAIRPTKIRVAIANLLFDGHNKHVTVEDVIDMARRAQLSTSVASVYNTLNQFTDAGLLRRMTIDHGKAYFDTNTDVHHHFYFEDEDRLEDIAADDVVVSGLPSLPKGKKVKAIEVIIRV